MTHELNLDGSSALIHRSSSVSTDLDPRSKVH